MAPWGRTLSTAVAVLVLSAGHARAQDQVVVDLDAIEPSADSPEPSSVDEAATALGPVAAGRMTAEAQAAKRLFDKERWNSAAQALRRVADGSTGDDIGNRQLAEYYLAISLYRLKLLTASSQIFIGISDNPNHLKFKETLFWLVKLSTQTLSPEVIASACRYEELRISHGTEASNDLSWQYYYLCAGHELANRDHEQAIRYAGCVDPRSAYYGRSQLLAARAYYALGKPEAAHRVLHTAVDRVPRKERRPLRQVVTYLENRHAQPTATWRNGALRYWQRRGFSR